MEVQSLAMLANMLAHKFNVNVRAVGPEAYCTMNNGVTEITVPAFVVDNDASRVYVRGYIDHEIGHARFTDWNATKKIQNDAPLHHIANILEDVYVERMMGKCYPGCAINLANMQKQLFVKDRVCENITQSPFKRDARILKEFFRYLLYRCRGIDELLPVAKAELDKCVSGFADKLDALLNDRLSKCNSTADNIELARDIRKLFVDNAEEQAQKDYEEVCNNPSMETREKEDNAAAKRAASACMQNKKDGYSKDADAFITVTMDNISTAVQGKLNSSNEKVRFASSELSAVGYDLKQSQRAVAEATPDIKDMAMRCATALSAQLQSLMQAKVLRKRRVGVQGKLDTNRLHRISMNNPNVFLRNNEIKQVNTQVILLGDTSGSMDGIRKLASAAMYAVMSALRNIHGVQSAAFGFGDRAISTMCDFNTPLYKGKMSIENPSGGTPGGTALQQVMQKFDLIKPELRKILFFITDGDFPHNEAKVFKAAYRDAKEADIDVIGIGIGTDAVSRLWNQGDFFVINNIKELAPKLFEILKARMV